MHVILVFVPSSSCFFWPCDVIFVCMSVCLKAVEVKKTEVPPEKIAVTKPKKETEITPTKGRLEATDILYRCPL